MSEPDVSKLYDNLPDNSHRSRNEKQAMKASGEGRSWKGKN